jgi:hypothetical protein
MNKERKPEALKPLPTLAALEQEVVAEYRELGRQELERRVQQLAKQTGEVFPPATAETPKPGPAD